MTGLKELNLCFMFLMLLVAVFCVPSIFAQENFIVTIGQNKVFTTTNIHDTETGAGSNHQWRDMPSIIDANSAGQEASTHILAEIYQEGFAKSWVGVNFTVVANKDGKETQEANISIKFDYRLSADFQVPPPSEGGGGSVDAIISGLIAEKHYTVYRINFVHYSNKGQKSGNETLMHRLNLEAGQDYEVLTHIYSHGGVWISGYADSQAYVCVQEIRIEFEDVTPPPCLSEKLYGEHSEETELFRYFRDNLLSASLEGQQIIKLYYQWSPVLVKAMERDEEFKEEMKEMIDGVLELIGGEAE